MTVSFIVYGNPQPQGSTRAFMPKGARFPVVTSDNAKLKPWRQDVAMQALVAMAAQAPQAGAATVSCAFFFARPKTLRASVLVKTTKPDLDKLVRGIMDGITGICIDDDAQVVGIVAAKNFGLPERAEILVDIT